MNKYIEENNEMDTDMSQCSTERWYNKLLAIKGLKGKNLSKKRLLSRIIFQLVDKILDVEDVFSEFITSSVNIYRSHPITPHNHARNIREHQTQIKNVAIYFWVCKYMTDK